MFLRILLYKEIVREQKDIEVVAINDLGTSDFNAHLLQYDSVHGQFPYKVKSSKTSINAGLGPIKIFSERNPEDLPWKKLGVDVVMECTGIFTDKAKASLHINAGAKRVLISAPSKDADITVVYGVNHQKIRKSHKVISNASCTTNCLAPVAMVLDKLCGINQGYMTTIHSYTGDQKIIDTTHKDLRRARAGAVSMIPTSTGAAKAVGLVIEEVKGKLDGCAIRVPTPNVSMIDLTFQSAKQISAKEINDQFLKSSQSELKNILGYNTEDLVSIDFNHSSFSSIFDSTQTQVIQNDFCRVVSWYDNEWGFSNRMIDVATYMYHNT
jgi:glyceraldehyde 3-phosphate dehydrogenase